MKTPCDPDDCRIVKIQEVLFGKWKLSILWYVHHKNINTFNALQRALDGISHKILSQSLKELVESGLLTKNVYESKEPKTEYLLTPTGLAFMPILKDMEQWVEASYYDK